MEWKRLKIFVSIVISLLITGGSLIPVTFANSSIGTGFVKEQQDFSYTANQLLMMHLF